MIRNRLTGSLVAAWLCTALHAAGATGASLQEDAVQRLAESHDPALVVAIGRIVVKQAGLKAAQALLREQGQAAGLDPRKWNASAPEWREAEQQLMQPVDALIQARIEDPAWFRFAIAAIATRSLSAEEADELVRHFATEGGREQRIALEADIFGELLLANYTFTNRIEAGVKGTEREMSALQTVYWAHEPFRVRDFSPYPEALRFVSQGPGIKYTKLLAIQGIEALTAHVDGAARAAAEAVRAAGPQAASYLEAFRQRAGAR